MKFKMAVDQHTMQLLKISYLYVQDLQRAQQLVHEAYRKLSAKNKEDLPFNQMKLLLIKYVVEGSHVYFRSWSTLKEMLLGEMLNATSKHKRRYLKPLITLGVVAIAIGLGAWAFAPKQAAESEKGQVQSFPVSEGEASRI